VLTYASIIFGDMLASVNSVKNPVVLSLSVGLYWTGQHGCTVSGLNGGANRYASWSLLTSGVVN